MEISATIVFEQLWEAIHERNEDGERTYRYIILEGSSRSSKTHSIITAFYLYALANKQKRLSVWRDTKKLTKDTVGKDMKDLYVNMPYFHEKVLFNKTESIYHFWNKSDVEICGTDEPNKAHGYNGDVIWLNEPYDISEETFNQLDQRTSDVVIVDWNPKQSHWVDKLKGNARAIVLHSTYKDNPFCPHEQRTKIESYQPVKWCEVVMNETISQTVAINYDIKDNPNNLTDLQIKELARCQINESSRTANEFNWQVYGLGIKGENPNRIYYWNEIPERDFFALDSETYYGIDWGQVDPWAILAAKYYDGELFLHELNYESENEIKMRLSPTEWHQINGEDEGLVSWRVNQLNISKKAIIVCDNNRPLKVRALRLSGYERSISATKGQGSLLDGIGLLSSLRVNYTASSSNIRHETENYRRKVDRYGITEEEPMDANNHLMDAANYITTFLHLQGIIRKI